MAKGVRVRKTAHRRQVSTITPDKKHLDPLLKRCKDFLDVNSSLSMDDSFDRDRLAEEMVEFVMLEIKLNEEAVAKWAFDTNR